MDRKAKITNFKDLIAWQVGHKLVVDLYSVTINFPKEEMFGLTNQMRKAAVSVTSNIAEGFSRTSYKEKVQFYSVALGSLTEVESQLLIARDVSYISHESMSFLNERILLLNKLINGLIKKSKTLILNSISIIL